ncbi:MAG: hypothetical protein KJ645_08935 [Planctomycetes bacterium]|nr:hypothetical protein [Planctomycetota bacterium]
MNIYQRLKILSFGWLLIVSGCAPFNLVSIPDREEVILTPENEMDYYDALKDKPRVSMADGIRMIFALTAESPHGKSVDTLRRHLIGKEIIPADWEITESAPLTKGKLAYMICNAADVRTSLIMKLGVSSERYALREAVYHELMTSSSIYRYVSGNELLDALSQTQDFLQRRRNRET